MSRSIDFTPSAQSSLAVSNTLVANNGNNGILVQPTGSGVATALFNRVAAHGNVLHGISISSALTTEPVNAVVVDSVASSNGGSGFFVGSGAGATPISVALVRSVASRNDIGLTANNAGATLRVAQSTVTGNVHGWSAVGGALLSYVDNEIDGNGGDEAAPTMIATK